MRLDDRQIERYSRQIVLPEVGVDGQRRLARARVAVGGEGTAAATAVAYLAAAGVGTILAPPALCAALDPAVRGSVRTELDGRAVDVALAVHRDRDPIAPRAGAAPRAAHRLWIADGRAGETPPCPACAAALLPPPAPVPAALAGIRDRLLGTVVATEVVKLIVGAGAPLGGHVLAYDPAVATVVVTALAPRAGCAVCTASRMARA